MPLLEIDHQQAGSLRYLSFNTIILSTPSGTAFSFYDPSLLSFTTIVLSIPSGTAFSFLPLTFWSYCPHTLIDFLVSVESSGAMNSITHPSRNSGHVLGSTVILQTRVQALETIENGHLLWLPYHIDIWRFCPSTQALQNLCRTLSLDWNVFRKKYENASQVPKSVHGHYVVVLRTYDLPGSDDLPGLRMIEFCTVSPRRDSVFLRCILIDYRLPAARLFGMAVSKSIPEFFATSSLQSVELVPDDVLVSMSPRTCRNLLSKLHATAATGSWKEEAATRRPISP